MWHRGEGAPSLPERGTLSSIDLLPGGTFTSVPGVTVGHWTDEIARTGVTVMVYPEPNVAAVEVRGGAPGTRETALLGHGMRVQTIQALVFSGGSAFGLASADGVVRRLEADGRGHATIAGLVPIVPAAIIFDLMVGDGSVRPGPEEGAAAYDARSSEPVAVGAVGVGVGAHVAGWRGFTHLRRGGIGSVAVRVGDATLAAIVVVNAVGDAFTLEGESLTGGPHAPGPPVIPTPPAAPSGIEQTTLVSLVTDAALDRGELSRLIVRAHDALGACLRPVHTRFDGDIAFAVSCGAVPADVEALSEAAFVATARSIETGLRATWAADPQ